MRVKIYRQFGALNSKPVFDAVSKGLLRLGHEIVENNEDLAVIWSVLWSGRMQSNAAIYHQCKKRSIPVMIIEVGNLKRNITWRICLENINREGKFGNCVDIDENRSKKLGVFLKAEKHNRQDYILIACQHQKSLQWEGLPDTATWVKNTVEKIRGVTDRKIIVRPHPRNLFKLNIQNVTVQQPKKISHTYDDFDIDYNAHAVINHNSGPAVQAAIEGVPIICHRSSLAYPVSDILKNLENPSLPDREKWFLDLCHTEWTLEEISSGDPIRKLFFHLG